MPTELGVYSVRVSVMETTLGLELFVGAFLTVGLKAAQQLNVVHHRIHLVPFFSYALALCEIAVMYRGVTNWTEHPAEIVFCVGTGAWMGCIFSMWAHKRMRG